MKQAAGILFYRQNIKVDMTQDPEKRSSELQVLLVHPSGNYNAKAPWSIPKGESEEGETLEATARREVQEETGLIADQLVAIGSIDYLKSRKRVHCWISPAPIEQPRCASWEIDKAEFLSIEDAKKKIHPDQKPFLTRLQENLRLQ